MITFTATPETDELESIEVRITGVRDGGMRRRAEIALFRNGERLDLERPGIAELRDLPDERGGVVPVLYLRGTYVGQVFDVDREEVAVKLDRPWKPEVEQYLSAWEEEQRAAARERVAEDPDMPVTVSRSYGGYGTYYHARGVDDEAVRNYLNELLSSDGAGVGEVLDYKPQWDGGGSCETTAGEIVRRADEKREKEREEAERAAEEQARREAKEKAAAEGREILRFSCELRPHTKDLSGVILNRPAPQGGAFLMNRRLPKEEWKALKEAGAWYWSKDDLEQFDMFFSPAGWRYSLAALGAALDLGYAVQVDDALPVTSTEALRALFDEDASAAKDASTSGNSSTTDAPS
jgi:hypothetical protein